MTEKPSRPNFFIELGLNPNNPWDQAAFERALSDKRSEWARRRSGIKTHPATVAARRNLALLTELEKVMRDPELRKAERESARKERAVELQQRRDRFRDQVDLLLAKGFLYDVELEALQTEAADLLADDPELQRRLKKARKRSFQQARSDHERLDRATERNLQANLAVLHDSDLYETLRRADKDITDTAPRDQLLAAADALYRKAVNTMDKRNPEIGAMQEIAGIARRIFSSDELARRHNLSMRLVHVDALLEQYETTLSATRIVDAMQAQRFLRQAAEKKIDPSLARDLLVSFFRDRNWTVELPGPETEKKLKRLLACPRCDTLNEPNVEFCVSCGRPLQQRCPRCGELVPGTSRACGKCGFPTGERDYVTYLADEAEAALNRQDGDEARVTIGRAQQIWPLGPSSPDALATRLHGLQRRLASLEAERRATAAKIAELKGKIADLMGRRCYWTALHELRGVTIDLPNVELLLSECQARVRAADELRAQAAEAGLSSERRAALYVAALRECEDHEDARRELEKIPPPPPRGLSVAPLPDRAIVRLSWQPTASSGVEFVVVRADGADPPVSAADAPGQRRLKANLTEPRWDDIQALIGVPMRYAVYTERSGIVSIEPALAPDPVFLTAEPRIAARPGDGQVEVSWTLPAHASGVEIVRAETSAPGTAVKLASADPGPLLDRDARNGVRYRYTVHAVFPYPTAGNPGRVQLSPGVSCEATPGPSLRPPQQLGARGGPPPPGMSFYIHQVELRWPPSERGVIKVVRSENQPALRYKDELAEHDLGRHGLVLEGSPPLLDTWLDDLKFCHYVPVLAVGGRCYVGRARCYATVDEVSDLTVEFQGTSALLHWIWPANAIAALVAWDEDEEPFDPAVAPQQHRVSRGAVQKAGEYQLPVSPGGRVFVRVAVVVDHDGIEFVSSGIPATAQRPPTRLRYKVRPVRAMGGRRIELILRVDHPAALPALQLRGRQDDRPAGSDDMLLMDVTPREVNRELVLRSASDQRIEPRSCRLFVTNPEDATTVVMSGPGADDP